MFTTHVCKRTVVCLSAGSLVVFGAIRSVPAADPEPVRFGVTTDAHLLGRSTPQNEAHLKRFIGEMVAWRPDFAIDLGDFACQCRSGRTTPAEHRCQLEGLLHHLSVTAGAACPRYHVLGNHDAGWFRGGDEKIDVKDLFSSPHAGEHVTKAEFVKHTCVPGRYYSFDVKGIHFIVLDGNNGRDGQSPAPGRDGVEGSYIIDAAQKAWLSEDLAWHRDRLKVVFSHEELHHTPPEGYAEGGDRPFPPVGKETSFIDNGWELRTLFEADGKVLVCFAGHKHSNRWTIRGGVHYITLAALHWEGSYAKVTVGSGLRIEGSGKQREYDIPLVGPCLDARRQHE